MSDDSDSITDDLKTLFYTVVNKSNIILLIWFLAIYFVCHFLLGFLLKRNVEDLSYQSRLSKMLDMTVLGFFLIFMIASYYSVSIDQKQNILETAADYFKNYINDPNSIVSSMGFIVLLYLVVYLFRIPMTNESKPFFVSLLENSAWILLLITIMVQFFKSIFKISMMDIIYSFFNWTNIPINTRQVANTVASVRSDIAKEIEVEIDKIENDLTELPDLTFKKTADFSKDTAKITGRAGDKVENIFKNESLYDFLCTIFGGCSPKEQPKEQPKNSNGVSTPAPTPAPSVTISPGLKSIPTPVPGLVQNSNPMPPQLQVPTPIPNSIQLPTPSLVISNPPLPVPLKTLAPVEKNPKQYAALLNSLPDPDVSVGDLSRYITTFPPVADSVMSANSQPVTQVTMQPMTQVTAASNLQIIDVPVTTPQSIVTTPALSESFSNYSTANTKTTLYRSKKDGVYDNEPLEEETKLSEYSGIPTVGKNPYLNLGVTYFDKKHLPESKSDRIAIQKYRNGTWSSSI